MVQLTPSTKTFVLNTGAKIPAFGLGTWQSSSDEVYGAVLSALRAGYRHIDTAAIYANEGSVGKAIRDSGIPREHIFVTTKMWITQHRNPVEALDISLKKLGLDYVDLYLIHAPIILEKQADDPLDFSPVRKCVAVDANEWDFIKTWELMQKLPETGKTKAIGISNFSVKQIEQLLNDERTKIVPAVNQVEMHPYLPQNELLDYCKSKGILMEGYSSLGSSDAPLMKQATIVKIAEKHNVSPAHVLLNYIVAKGAVVLPKSVKDERIVANLQAFDLPEQDVSEIEKIHKEEGIRRFLHFDFCGKSIFEE